MPRLISMLSNILALFSVACAPAGVYRSQLIEQGPAGKQGVCVTWLGTAGVLVDDGRTGVLIDPYVSRFGILRVGSGASLSPDRRLIRQWVDRLGAGRIQAVVVSHSHFDHSLDAPYFAMESGAPLIGSPSTLNIGRGAGLHETQLITVQPGQPLTFGDFTLRFLESEHGPALFGRVPYPGTIDKPLIPPQPGSAYKLGGVYSILISHPSGTLLHHGSAGFRPGMYAGIHADVVLLGIAGRGDTGEYLAQVPLKVTARVLIPIHFDNFFQPLDRGVSFLYNVNFTDFCDQAKKASLAVKTIPLGKPVRVLPLPQTE